MPKPKKSIWIDLDNSPHVLFFDPIIKELSKRGYDVFITSRDTAQVSELADLFGIQHTCVGKRFGKLKILKIAGSILRSFQLLPLVLRRRPSLAVSHGSRSQLLASRLLKIPSMLIMDYEHAKGLLSLNPDWVLTPQYLPESTLGKHRSTLIKYPGIKEDVYVPFFHANGNLVPLIGNVPDEDRIIVTVRPPATDSHYHHQLSNRLFMRAMNYLGEIDNTLVILLPRNPQQNRLYKKIYSNQIESGKIIVPEGPVNGLNLLWHSDLVISGGGTMNREAAALDIPVYSIFGGKLGSIDHHLSSTGKLILLKSEKDISEKLKIVKRKRTEHQQKDLDAFNAVIKAITAPLDH